MPVQYKSGVLSEHLHTRSKAGFFDVSQMGQIKIRPKKLDIDNKISVIIEEIIKNLYPSG